MVSRSLLGYVLKRGSLLFKRAVLMVLKDLSLSLLPSLLPSRGRVEEQVIFAYFTILDKKKNKPHVRKKLHSCYVPLITLK